MSRKTGRIVGIIGDLHLPFEHKDYLSFCIEQKRKHKWDTIVQIGDLVDNHALSYFEADPDMHSPGTEMELVDDHLKPWFKAFPKVLLCHGNHDNRLAIRSKTSGLPKRCLRSYRDVWQLPKGWKDDLYHIIDGVLYEHGTTYGKMAHLAAAINNRQSTVMGHSHSFAGIAYTASKKDCIFGMNVGCGINIKSPAFNYAKHHKNRPIIACATVYYGESPQIHRMIM